MNAGSMTRTATKSAQRLAYCAGQDAANRCGTAALVTSGLWLPPVVSGMSDDAEIGQPPAPETAVATEDAEDLLSNSKVSYRNWWFPPQRGNYASTNLGNLKVSWVSK